MGTSPDIYCKLTTGCIPARLKSHFVIENAELSIDALIALVHAYATGLIRHSACMVILEEMHQPSMQLLHNESYCH
jgi:hypothetical protein